jgi:calcineurin-like phosphoesterase family protein
MPRSLARGAARPTSLRNRTDRRDGIVDAISGAGLDGMAIYFTADTHFGDPHILRHRRARFGSVEAHDEALVAGWNAVVGPEDSVWHLGDFAAHASRDHCAAIFARLNGTKRLVRGNHDSNRVLDLPWAEPPVDSVRLSVPDAQGHAHRLFLSHYAHRAWPGLWRETRHLYGHSHGWLPDTTRSCDVGVDAWSDRPATLAAILARQEAAVLVPEELAAHGLR